MEVPAGLTVTSTIMYEGKPIIVRDPQYNTLITFRMMTQVQPMESIKKISMTMLYMDINNMIWMTPPLMRMTLPWVSE